MTAFHFRCTECDAAYPEDPGLLVCPTCTVRQARGGALRGVLQVVLDRLPDAWPPPHAPWPLADWWPVRDALVLPPFPVGATPLLDVPTLRERLGTPWLWLKDDTRNPSGSTKDRASLLVVAKAREYGLETVAAASTGNAATALAAVAAAASLRAVVFVPASAPPAKLIQLLSYGATVYRVDGSYDDAFELCLDACRTLGWYNRNTGLNPFTIEGKKTVALEIGAALASAPPDVVLVPTGDGVILSGVAKGFADLVRAGLLAGAPRLVVVQPEGSAGIVHALGAGTVDVTAVPDAHSVADSLTVQTPRNARRCLSDVRASGGGGVTVSDAAIVAAIARLARWTGVFAEPAGAAVLAGLDAALTAGLVERGERIVLLVTGTGLKDVGAAARAVTTPAPIPPSLEAVLAHE
ncbi:MAG: pyridoxal-phosphate dependent enzyme, partial [Gemmatimonadota bacterium]|nr:pyridoxal-phosphate dependent enzyme [Gemmatimonadota bacterium]